MGTIFCPYRGQDIDEAMSSTEHVVPESIGGTKELSIRVERQANMDLGSAVDGPVSTQLFAHHRLKYDLRGHSGRAPVIGVEISVEALGGHRGRWEVSGERSAVGLAPVVKRGLGPEGQNLVEVAGGPAEAWRIFNEIRKAREAEGKTVTITSELEQKIEQPWITGTFTFDTLAISRFFVKTCIGVVHWLAGERWSRGSEAERLRRALWSNTVNELEAVGLETGSSTPSELGLQVDEWEHAFVLTDHPAIGSCLDLFFFGRQGYLMRVGNLGSALAAFPPLAVLVVPRQNSSERE